MFDAFGDALNKAYFVTLIIAPVLFMIGSILVGTLSWRLFIKDKIKNNLVRFILEVEACLLGGFIAAFVGVKIIVLLS